MKYHFRFYLLFAFFTLLFLFYPGDIYPFTTFAFNRELFSTQPPAKSVPQRIDVPRLINPIYPEVSAEGVYVVDKNSMSPVLERRTHDLFQPASTAKVLTALVAYDMYKPSDIVTVKHVVNEGQVMGLFPGERITVENLLYGLLIHSGNDAAFALADNIGREKYVELVNQKAQSLHMTNTVIKNPAGLDEAGQHMSPFDLALAGRELLKNDYLRKIVGIKEIIISDVDYKSFHTLTNVNKLLGELQGVGGLKTGYTEEAGENLVTFYKKNGHEFLIVLLKSQDRFEDTRSVVNWIDSNVTFSTITL